MCQCLQQNLEAIKCLSFFFFLLFSIFSFSLNVSVCSLNTLDFIFGVPLTAQVSDVFQSTVTVLEQKCLLLLQDHTFWVSFLQDIGVVWRLLCMHSLHANKMQYNGLRGIQFINWLYKIQIIVLYAATGLSSYLIGWSFICIYFLAFIFVSHLSVFLFVMFICFSFLLWFLQINLAKDPRWVNSTRNCHKWCWVFYSLQAHKTPDTGGGDSDFSSLHDWIICLLLFKLSWTLIFSSVFIFLWDWSTYFICRSKSARVLWL